MPPAAVSPLASMDLRVLIFKRREYQPHGHVFLRIHKYECPQPSWLHGNHPGKCVCVQAPTPTGCCDLGKLVSLCQVFVFSSVKWGGLWHQLHRAGKEQRAKTTRNSAPRAVSMVPTDQEICGIGSFTVIRNRSVACAEPGCDLYSLWPPQHGC